MRSDCLPAGCLPQIIAMIHSLDADGSGLVASDARRSTLVKIGMCTDRVGSLVSDGKFDLNGMIQYEHVLQWIFTSTGVTPSTSPPEAVPQSPLAIWVGTCVNTMEFHGV